MSSAAPRDRNEDSELIEVREKAMSLLMEKMENEVHKLFASDEEKLEVWEGKGWKYAPAALKEEVTGKEESVSSGIVGHSKRKGNWFSNS